VHFRTILYPKKCLHTASRIDTRLAVAKVSRVRVMGKASHVYSISLILNPIPKL